MGDVVFGADLVFTGGYGQTQGFHPTNLTLDQLNSELQNWNREYKGWNVTTSDEFKYNTDNPSVHVALSAPDPTGIVPQVTNNLETFPTITNTPKPMPVTLNSPLDTKASPPANSGGTMAGFVLGILGLIAAAAIFSKKRGR